MRKSKGRRRNVDAEENDSAANDSSEYEVEHILDSRIRKKKREYLVRWKGFTEDDDTWEAEDQVNCPDLIKKFLEEEKNDEEPLAKSTKKGQKRKGKVVKGRGRPKKERTEESDEEADPNKEYEVDKILEVHHKKNGSKEFLVRWKGFRKDDDTWEPESNLTCPELIEAFMVKVKKAKSTTPRETRVNRKATDRFVLNSPDSGRKLSGRNRGARRTYYEEDE